MGHAGVIFDGVWKKFRRGERHNSLRDLIPAALGRLAPARGRESLEGREFWALRDVSFEVGSGEALGIIGPNGAGKSTTLKLLSRILKPTRGRCEVRGRVGALIEVAAGFHPDLTGRENIYLQGAIMGMKREEVSRKLDEIVEFAGAGEFIETPVKRYSSGMNARLGFSIAAHLDPDILLIDEVLSVGDMAFQRRCIERMAAFKRAGTAIVFVSHNLQAVAGLCERACFLSGELKGLGPATEVIEDYVSSLRSTSAPERAEVEISNVELLDNRGRPVTAVTPHASVVLRVSCQANSPIADWHVGVLVRRSSDELPVFAQSVENERLGLGAVAGGDRFTIEFDMRVHLARGQYHFECHVMDDASQRFVGRVSPAALLRVDEWHTYNGPADLQLTSRLVDFSTATGRVVGARSRLGAASC